MTGGGAGQSVVHILVRASLNYPQWCARQNRAEHEEAGQAAQRSYGQCGEGSLSRLSAETRLNCDPQLPFAQLHGNG